MPSYERKTAQAARKLRHQTAKPGTYKTRPKKEAEPEKPQKNEAE